MTSAAAGTDERADRVHERRVRALLASFRQLRHDLASPLSGAALHLEMASRRLEQRQDTELAKLAENVRVSQQEISWASGVLDLLGEMARSAEDALVPFSLADAVRRGAARSGARAARENVRIDLPPDSGPDLALFGAAGRLENAFADLTAHALVRTGRGGVIAWSLEVRSGEAEAGVDWPLTPGERPERAFALQRRQPGESPDAGLFLARWAVESLGGTLSLEAEGDRVRVRATFPREENS